MRSVTFMDLVKAYNRANREVILKTAQRMAGAGKLFKSMFDDPVTYVYNGKEYAFISNCGGFPGRLSGNQSFYLFIINDKTLTEENYQLLTANPFSDDRSPLFNKDQIDSGYAQEVLDESFKFMESVGCEYHGNFKFKDGELFRTRRSRYIRCSNYLNQQCQIVEKTLR